MIIQPALKSPRHRGDRYRFLVKTGGISKYFPKANNLMSFDDYEQPRSQGSLLPVPGNEVGLRNVPETAVPTMVCYT